MKVKGEEEPLHLVWDHDVGENKRGRQVHGGLLVFGFVFVPLLVFLNTENRNR